MRQLVTLHLQPVTQQGCEAAGHVASAARSQRLMLLLRLLFILPGSPVHIMVPPYSKWLFPHQLTKSTKSFINMCRLWAPKVLGPSQIGNVSCSRGKLAYKMPLAL